MSQAHSPSTNKPYGAARVLAVWNLARSSYYAAKKRQAKPQPPAQKRGPKRLCDEEVLVQIRQVLAESVFAAEGYRKVWARMRMKGIRVWKERILRLMREADLLSPNRRPAHRPGNPHEGSIVPMEPNQVWGTDGTATTTIEDGKVTIFAAIDHYSADCLGIHVVKKGHRFEALEPIRQAVRELFGAFTPGAAPGIRLRHDHGSVYMSDDFQNEIKLLGMESSPSFVRQPEGNGCIERFFRTLKEQLLWVRDFRNLEELREALVTFRETYNEHWIVERLKYQTPNQARRTFSLALRQAA